MKTQDAIDHFGGTQAALAKAIGLSRSAVQQWGEYPPDDKQLEIQSATGGKLTVEPEVIARYRELLNKAEQRA